MIPESVEVLPKYLDCLWLYKLETTYNLWTKKTANLQYFSMVTSSKSGYHGYRKIGKCEGSWVCNNPQCSFQLTLFNNQPNRIDWKSVQEKKHLKVCEICDHMAVWEGCGACKLIDLNPKTNEALVYHLGTHVCWNRTDTHEIQQIQKDKAESSRRTRSEKQMAFEDIVKKITEGDMAGAEVEADYWSDLKCAKRVHNKANPNYSEDLNSFDTVGIIKQATDKKDKYYIYQINNGNLNNNSDFVSKSSRTMAELAKVMDVDFPLSSVLQQENAYFDATHTHVHGFKSLGLWMFHPSMRKILQLASMDIRSENAKDIMTFFRLFNEILQFETGNPEYKFNPWAFMCDDGSANYRTIQLVYGDDFTVVGYQWHFKNDTIRKARQVGPDMRDLFTTLQMFMHNYHSCQIQNSKSLSINYKLDRLVE